MILGITGKIAVGKNVAAQFLEQRGWTILDADIIAHRLYRPYQRIWREVVDRFGEGILKKDDVIDRQKLRQIVFGSDEASKKALQDLNQIVHPELKRHLKDEIYYLRKKQRNVVVIATLWKELDLIELCDKVLLIKAGDALAYERVHKRDGMNFDMFEMVNASQSEPPNPDFVIENEEDFQQLYKQLNVVVNQL